MADDIGIMEGSGVRIGDRLAHYPWGSPPDPIMAPSGEPLYLTPIFFLMLKMEGMTPRKVYQVLDIEPAGLGCVLLTVEDDFGRERKLSGLHFRYPPPIFES